eukprot:6891459-Ditylum_brightwellii.AAC.1
MVSKVIERAIYQRPQIVDSQKQYCFGKEVVIMQNQMFWHFYLNKWLKAVLFGIRFEKIHNNNELVYKTKKKV